MKNKESNHNNDRLKKLFSYSVLFIISFSYLGGLISSLFFMRIGSDLNYLPALLNVTLFLVVIYMSKTNIDRLKINKLDKIYKIAKILIVYCAISFMVNLSIAPLSYSLLNELFVDNIQPSDQFNTINYYLYVELLNNLFAGIVGIMFSYIFIKLENPK